MNSQLPDFFLYTQTQAQSQDPRMFVRQGVPITPINPIDHMSALRHDLRHEMSQQVLKAGTRAENRRLLLEVHEWLQEIMNAQNRNMANFEWARETTDYSIASMRQRLDYNEAETKSLRAELGEVRERMDALLKAKDENGLLEDLEDMFLSNGMTLEVLRGFQPMLQDFVDKRSANSKAGRDRV